MADSGSSSMPEDVQRYLIMLAVQFGYAGSHVLSRVALNTGINMTVFLVYKYIIVLLLFILLAFRNEDGNRRGDWRGNRRRDKAFRTKMAGALLCVFGASVITLYKGPTIFGPAAERHLFLCVGDAKGKNWKLGCICLIGHCFLSSVWNVMEESVVKKSSSRRLYITSCTCIFGVLQFLVIDVVAASMGWNSEARLVLPGTECFNVWYMVRYNPTLLRNNK
ncbi:hypothetical protein NE237_032579 [Protea cynaroides]|uniref:WAT1-related protein n=1 Tax=Protea cynaroides TaxID=273540 RepID=A0A9Q0L3D7_9MAGN|nr:hypothetical protein NE237_032579 [Protea cynaroides]